jgi:hypothetical protein
MGDYYEKIIITINNTFLYAVFSYLAANVHPSE